MLPVPQIFHTYFIRPSILPLHTPISISLLKPNSDIFLCSTGASSFTQHFNIHNNTFCTVLYYTFIIHLSFFEGKDHRAPISMSVGISPVLPQKKVSPINDFFLKNLKLKPSLEEDLSLTTLPVRHSLQINFPLGISVNPRHSRWKAPQH